MKAAHPEVAVAPGQNPGELLRQARDDSDIEREQVLNEIVEKRPFKERMNGDNK